jgi:hypothetical protein
MKINAVKDQSGKVIATFETASERGVKMTPVLPEGHRVEEIEVADAYMDDPSALYSEKNN